MYIFPLSFSALKDVCLSMIALWAIISPSLFLIFWTIIFTLSSSSLISLIYSLVLQIDTMSLFSYTNINMIFVTKSPVYSQTFLGTRTSPTQFSGHDVKFH